MDSFLNNEDFTQHIETRWDRIEKRHINSAIVYDQSDAAADICKEIIENKEFITGNHLKTLLGEKPKHFRLDPNLVMDLRHSKIRRRNKSTTSVSRRRAKSFIDERSHFQKMFQMNREIQKYKKSLENIRPKSDDHKHFDSRMSDEKNGIDERGENHYSLDCCSLNCCSLDCLKFDIPSHIVGDAKNSSLLNCLRKEEKICYEIEKSEEDRSNEIDYRDNQIQRTSSPLPIPSEYLIDETYTTDGISIDDSNDIFTQNSDREQQINRESIIVSPCSSTHTVIKPMPQIHRSEEFQFIINPTIMVNIQDASRSNHSSDFDSGQEYDQTKPSGIPRETKIAVNQQMSIFIKKLSNDGPYLKDSYISDAYGNYTNDEFFNQKPQDDFLCIQKYFLRWIHYNTIEKLKRRNPTQTRLQKMEAFLQNIAKERKRALNKFRRPGNMLSIHRSDDFKQTTLHSQRLESPRLLTRTYNNKIKSQQDIIDLQKIKLERQQRIITEMKLSKLLEDTNEAEHHLKEELGMVIRNGGANSRSKAKCLQIAGNLKDKNESEDFDLHAKGTRVPKFLIEMQARALERQMRHQEAQRRREAIEREKEAMRIASEEEKRLLDEQSKRDRIRQYWRKRREEKELEEKKALERMRFLENMERAKSFDQNRLLKMAINKFRNLVKWKHRNIKVSKELRYRIICRDYFKKWREITAKIWTERKAKADACYNLHLKMATWASWQQLFLIAQSKKMLAEDWFNYKITERVLRAWDRITAQTRLKIEIKEKQAEAHFNWYMKWKVLEHWRRLHAILKIEKETKERRERWRSKVIELIPDYTPNDEFI